MSKEESHDSQNEDASCKTDIFDTLVSLIMAEAEEDMFAKVAEQFKKRADKDE